MKFIENSVKKRMGLLGLGSAVLIAAAALGMHGFQVLGTEAGQEARLKGQEIQPESQEARLKGQETQLESREVQLNGKKTQPESGAKRDAAGTGENAAWDVYPEEEFFETETDMTEFEGKLEDITA